MLSRTRGSNRGVTAVLRNRERLGLVSMGDRESKGVDKGGPNVPQLGAQRPVDGIREEGEQDRYRIYRRYESAEM